MKHILLSLIAIFQLSHVQATDLSSVLDPNKLPNPFDGQNNLYNRIFTELNSEYMHIGQRQAQTILQNNKLSVTGGLNSIGLSYHRPFGEFSILLDRNLAPDLFDDKRWIVTDTFSIHIDASKVMRKLKDENVINLDENNMAAFVGLVFKRTFTWVHYANSYDEGLSTHFEKLFFPFQALTFETMANLANNEMIFKEDSLSLNAGGFVSAPVYPGVAVMGGVLAKFQKMSRFEAIARENNHLQLSLEKSKIISGGASFAVQALFLKVIKLTLLSYDFEYNHESSYKVYTDFSKNELKEMTRENPVAKEINEIIKNKEVDLVTLAPYIISEEKKVAQNINHRYNFLIFGGQKSSKTQEIEITKAGRVKSFFRHYFEKIKYTEDFLSKIFGGFLAALINVDSTTAKVASETKKVEIEYDSEKNLLDAHEDIDLGLVSENSPDMQKLSLKFSAELMTKKTDGSQGKKYRERAVFALERYSGVDPLVPQMLEREHLKAPLLVQGHYQVNTDGIRYFNALKIDNVFNHFSGLCDEKPTSKFFNFRSLFDNCRRSLENDYMAYVKDLTHNQIQGDQIALCQNKAKKFFFSPGKRRAFIKNCLDSITYKDADDWTKVPVWTLKNLSQNIANNTNSKIHYYNLFGLSNVFFYGSFDAVTSDGRSFFTTFHEGSFKGFGSVDHYMRKENLRSPASVIIDQ